jgi:hypothetical protein
MRHYDYTWDLEPHGIIFDDELNISRLGWKPGDCFKIVTCEGHTMMVKMDPIEQFARGYKVNSNE